MVTFTNQRGKFHNAIKQTINNVASQRCMASVKISADLSLRSCVTAESMGRLMVGRQNMLKIKMNSRPHCHQLLGGKTRR